MISLQSAIGHTMDNASSERILDCFLPVFLGAGQKAGSAKTPSLPGLPLLCVRITCTESPSPLLIVLATLSD